MTCVDIFQAAMAAAFLEPALSGPHLLPSRLAWAAAHALGGQGAGISWSSEAIRVPMGASSDEASDAERLQFTTGEGPCLDADALQEPIMASQAVITHSWPLYARAFLQETPYRSVYASPVPGVGALDVYFTDPAGCTLIDTGDAATVTDMIGTVLARTSPSGNSTGEDTSADSPQHRRHQVSIAMAMVAEARKLSAGEALAALRAHAFRTDSSLEDVADEVIHHPPSIDDLVP